MKKPKTYGSIIELRSNKTPKKIVPHNFVGLSPEMGGKTGNLMGIPWEYC